MNITIGHDYVTQVRLLAIRSDLGLIDLTLQSESRRTLEHVAEDFRAANGPKHVYVQCYHGTDTDPIVGGYVLLVRLLDSVHTEGFAFENLDPQPF